jgi:hypothetical protein
LGNFWEKAFWKVLGKLQPAIHCSGQHFTAEKNWKHNLPQSYYPAKKSGKTIHQEQFLEIAVNFPKVTCILFTANIPRLIHELLNKSKLNNCGTTQLCCGDFFAK